MIQGSLPDFGPTLGPYAANLEAMGERGRSPVARGRHSQKNVRPLQKQNPPSGVPLSHGMLCPFREHAAPS